jgi:exosortase
MNCSLPGNKWGVKNILASILWQARNHLNKSDEIIAILKIISIILLLGILYYPILIWMGQRWFAADSYYTHGPLIPILSLALIWIKRREIVKIPIESSKLGIWLIIAGLVLHIISSLTRIYFTSAYSLLIIITGIVVYLGGKKLAVAIIFPLCFLLFMIPAPIAIIESTTLKMKMFTAQMSVSIIQLIGTSVIREGSIVYMPNTIVTVDDPCSGLKSLISMLAIGTLFAYIAKTSYTRKTILFLLSIPIALFANIVRTTLMLLIANSYGNMILDNQILHQGLGLVVFVVAFVGLFIAGRLLGCRLQQKGI